MAKGLSDQYINLSFKMNVTSNTWIGNGSYFTCIATKAWRIFDYSISQFVLHSVWLILVQWSGTYTHLDGIIFGICFFLPNRIILTTWSVYQTIPRSVIIWRNSFRNSLRSFCVTSLETLHKGNNNRKDFLIIPTLMTIYPLFSEKDS